MDQNSRSFWQARINEAIHCGKVTVLKNDGISNVPRPKESGLFRRSLGEIKGQLADWRASVPGTDQCVHAVEYRDRYELHLDRYDPGKKPLEHLLYDSPKYAAMIATGAVATLAIVRTILKKK